MNYIKNIKMSFLAVVMVAASSCQTDDIVVGDAVDEGGYETVNDVYGYVKSVDNPRAEPVFEVRKGGLATGLYFGLTKEMAQAVDVKLAVDETLVADYNKAHGTSLAAFPEAFVSFEEGGAILMTPNTKQSDDVVVTLTTSEELVVGTTYVLPIVVKSVTDGVKLREPAYFMLIKYMGIIPDCTKTPDVKIFSCMEINDANPLNNLEYTLKGSGKLLVDVLIIFSANINYNAEKGRVYLNNNENVTFLLENREQFLKPLQDRGVKIVLGILGNHDAAGVACLSDATARYFAAELKDYADAYNLDGYFFDDEYSKYAPGPGFVSPSNAAAARLVFETKRAMPDKLCIPYIYGRTDSFTMTIDGVEPGDFIDYAIADYGRSAYTDSYLGSTIKQLCPWSSEYSQGRFIGTSNLQKLRTDGYGGHMIFALNPCRKKSEDNWSSQLNALKNIATYVYQDELVWTGNVYPKNVATSVSRSEWVSTSQPK